MSLLAKILRWITNVLKITKEKPNEVKVVEPIKVIPVVVKTVEPVIGPVKIIKVEDVLTKIKKEDTMSGTKSILKLDNISLAMTNDDTTDMGNVIDITSNGGGKGLNIAITHNAGDGRLGGMNISVNETGHSAESYGIAMNINGGFASAFRFNGQEAGIIGKGNDGFISDNNGTFVLLGFIRVHIGERPVYIPYGSVN